MFDPKDNMCIGGFGRVYYPPGRIVHQIAPRRLTISKDWRSALLYLLPPLLIVVRLTIFIRRRAGTDFANVDTHAGVEAALVMITCLVLAASRQTKMVLGRLSRMSIGMFLIFYGFAGLSAIWSPIPEYSAYRALEFASQFTAILVGIGCFGDFLRAEKAVLILGLLVASLGIAGTAKLTHLTSLRTNQYAASASMVLCYCFAEMRRATGRRRSMLAASALTGFSIVALGLCATTNVATLVGLLSGALFTWNRIALIFAVVLLSFVLILAPGLASDFQEIAKDILFPGKSDSQLENLHGRVPMWEAQLAVAKTSPFVGHGFAVQSRLQGTISAHNAWVQIFLDTGIVGVVLFSASVLMFVKEVVRRWNVVPLGLPGCAAAFICAFVHWVACPFVGGQWLAPSFTFAAFAGLYVNHVYCVTNHRLLHPESKYAGCLGHEIVP